MNDAITIRASATPLAFKCPASVRSPDVRISESSEPADLGTAAHEALRPLAEGAGVRWDELPDIAARHGVDDTDLRVLVAAAARLWPGIAPSFRDALTEVPLSVSVTDDVRLVGHLDFMAVSGDSARIGDWKTGRKDSDYSHQMKAYGALALLDDSSLREATVTVVWIRDAEIENYTMTRADADAWIESVRSRVIAWDGVFYPGPHCVFCPRAHECDARSAMVRRDAAALLDVDLLAALEVLPGEQVISLYRKAAMVKLAADRVHEAVRALVNARGDIVAPDGRLTMATEAKRSLDTAKAWPVLESVGFGDEEFADVIDVRLSRVEKLIAERAGKGKGAAAVRALGERLQAADAVKLTEVRKIVERRQ